MWAFLYTAIFVSAIFVSAIMDLAIWIGHHGFGHLTNNIILQGLRVAQAAVTERWP